MPIGNIKAEFEKLNIGKKIRELRKNADFTLEEVSKRTGLSKPLISQVEKGIVSPPIATLLKISNALNVKISFFFQDIMQDEAVTLIRKDQSKEIDSRYFGRDESGYYYEALAYKRSKKSMEPFLVEFKRTSAKKLSFLSHEGEEFVYLIAGSLEFRTKNEQYTLEVGDSLYFDSSIPHAYRSLNRRNAKAIVIVYSKR